MNPSCGAALGAIKDVDGYLAKFVPALTARLTREIRPLYDPSKETWHPALRSLGRAPFPAQGDAVMGLHRVLSKQKFAILVGECGVGKTLMAAALSVVHLGPRSRTLVMCPGHLVEKWAREIHETVPKAIVRIVQRVSDLLDLKRGSTPKGREYVIVARDRAKLGFRRKPAFVLRRRKVERTYRDEEIDRKLYVSCPACGEIVFDPKTVRPVTPDELTAKVEFCDRCDGALWQADRTGVRRYAPAEYVKRRLKGVFDLFLVDEVHELKGGDTAQGNALGMLAAACKKTVCLTGTLVGGYAEHLFHILYRVNPRGMRGDENLKYTQVQNWIARYGTLEIVTKKPLNAGESLAYARGRKERTHVKHRPGVSPLAFSRHLLSNSAFVELADVASVLPAFTEDVAVVPMSPDLAEPYKELESKFKRLLQDRRKAIRYLGIYLTTLLAYPDRPFDNKPIPEVGQPKELSKATVYPKEKALLDFVERELAAKRRVWVFATFTATRDVTERLRSLLAKRGIKAAVLKQDTVEMAEREAWIAEQVGHGVEVVISNPELVKTGLDLLSFPSLAFFETGYNTFTLMQASRRSWRVGQKEPVKVMYFCYQETLQEAALKLMGAKVKATMALQGKFSAEGLTALTQSEDMMSMLAKALVIGLDGVESAESYWRSAQAPGPERAAPPPVRAAVRSVPPRRLVAVLPSAEQLLLF